MNALPRPIARVIVDLPVPQPLDYLLPESGAESSPNIGTRCIVPVGRVRVAGILVGLADSSPIEPRRLRRVAQFLEGTQVSPLWLDFCRFAADYYHCGWGEMALPALPQRLRRAPGVRAGRTAPATGTPPALRGDDPGMPQAGAGPLRDEQIECIEAIRAAQGFARFLLFGITGSGKTEVYLGAIEATLARSPATQVLLLVPEINLTPQLEARLRARFGAHEIVLLHSSMTGLERDRSWMAAHEGRARILVGTRMAIFASLPGLALVIVDEEHDASFKSSSGAAWSARDLAVKRAQLHEVPVVLGSATPCLETWQQARAGRYRVLELHERGAGGAPAPPRVETVDLRIDPGTRGLTATLRAAIDGCLARGEQALIFLNRRGFAPVLCCAACGWLSDCPRCDAFAAFHKAAASLRCHHCGWSRPVPAACPTCGNQDLDPVGQGTQRVEESVREAWPGARILRIDRDTAMDEEGGGIPAGRGPGRRGAGQRAIEAVHAGRVDILVGTQMVAKGHDFRRVSTVGVLNADAQLVAPDFRAPERLFSLLLQVAGRAGRQGQSSRVLVQTRFPAHPLFAALARHDYARFAEEQLRERESAGMPPFAHQALLRASARDLDSAITWLLGCRDLAQGIAEPVTLYDPVPMPLARLAARSRAQLLVETRQRAPLHAFLDAWLVRIREAGSRGILHWDLEVDPQSI